jgi:mono/diheme cytochrome c family protein
MRRFRPAFVGLAVFVAAIGTATSLAAQAAGNSVDTIARGKTIFESTCRGCHTIAPPPQGGPPMSRIAQRYVRQLGSRTAAAARIAEWLAGPTVEKSLLPREEVARYGVMPHQPLADAGRFAVARYVVTLVDSGPARRGRGMRRP